MKDTLFVTDLDGTLLDGEGRLPGETLRILRPLVERGLPLSVCTARSWTSARDIVRELGIRLPVILYNGGHILDPLTGKTLFARCLDPGTAGELNALFLAAGLRPFVYTLDSQGDNRVYYRPAENAAEKRYLQSRLSRNDTRFRLEGAHGTWRGERVFFVNAIGTREELLSAAAALGGRPDLQVIFSEDIYAPGFWWLEVSDEAANKGAGIRFLRERFRPCRVVCFGDHVNDLPMFREADLAIAVANACPEAKAAAGLVIGPAALDFVARHIEAMISPSGAI